MSVALLGRRDNDGKMVGTRFVGLLVAAALALSMGCAAGPPAAAPTAAAAPAGAVPGAAAGAAAAPPPAAPAGHMTLPEFLGLPDLVHGIGAAAHKLRDHLGETFPDLKEIPAPEELGPDADAASEAAAEIKKDEDQAAEKAAALRYLAKIGCGCYPGVEEAFLAALDDCTEMVRFEAVKALRSLAGHPCSVCKSNSCCSEAIVRKLTQIVHDVDGRGCYTEPSTRVRRVARLALQSCAEPYIEEARPEEGPSRADLPPPEEEAVEAEPVVDPQAAASSDVTRAALPASFDQTRNMVMARVNAEPILHGEIVAAIQPRLAALSANFDAQSRQRLEQSLMRRELELAISRKLLCQVARQHRGGWPGMPLAAAGAQPGDARSVSYEAHPESEQALAAEWLARTSQQYIQISHEELHAYYLSERHRFPAPAAVRWEQISLVGPLGARQTDALEAMEQLRRRLTGNSPAESVAPLVTQAVSQTHGWTERAELTSAAIAEALFSLPVGQISSVIRDSDGLHLLRVLQTREAGPKPFEEIRSEVYQELLERRRQAFERDYLERLRGAAEIWTLFDTTPIPPVAPGVNRAPRRILAGPR